MKRIPVTVDASLEDRLDFLCTLLGLADRENVVDQAVALLDRCACAAADGERLVVRRRNGKLESFDL